MVEGEDPRIIKNNLVAVSSITILIIVMRIIKGMLMMLMWDAMKTWKRSRTSTGGLEAGTLKGGMLMRTLKKKKMRVLKRRSSRTRTKTKKMTLMSDV